MIIAHFILIESQHILSSRVKVSTYVTRNILSPAQDILTIGVGTVGAVGALAPASCR